MVVFFKMVNLVLGQPGSNGNQWTTLMNFTKAYNKNKNHPWLCLDSQVFFFNCIARILELYLFTIYLFNLGVHIASCQNKLYGYRLLSVEHASWFSFCTH